MATHSSILAWRIPWTEEPGRNTVHRVAESDTTEATWHGTVLHCFVWYFDSLTISSHSASKMSAIEPARRLASSCTY